MKSFFKKILNFFATLFGGNPREFLEQYAKPAVQIIQELRKVVKSDLITLATNLIPGDWDNALRAKAELALDAALGVLAINYECLQKGTLTEKLYCFILHVKELSPAMRKAVYTKLASEVAKAMSGQAGHKVDSLVQLQFSAMKENLEDEDELPGPLKTGVFNHATGKYD